MDQDKPQKVSFPQKTAQSYIDQRPMWPGGEALKSNKISPIQWFIWWLACAGKFFEGVLIFMSGLALPLIGMTFHIDLVEKGLYTASVLTGIFIGALFLGGLADRYGRKTLFIAETILLFVFLILSIVSVNYTMLLMCLFGMGLALGCDYPTAHLMIAESFPTKLRGRFILSAFGFQALGAFSGVLVAYSVLVFYPHPDAWRFFYAVLVVPVLIVGVGRLYIPESSVWLSNKNRMKEARVSLKKLLGRKYFILLRPVRADNQKNAPFSDLFKKKSLRAVMLTSLPWFLQDLATYGIGIFTPVILLQVLNFHAVHLANTVANIIQSDRINAKYTVALDFILILGIVVAVLLVDRIGRITLQVMGFIGCAIGLLMIAFGIKTGEPALGCIVIGFAIFNFMTNLGPNTQTYLLSGECFATGLRARGAGFAASMGKIGAISTAFLFPFFSAQVGVLPILELLVVTSLLGALITWIFRIKTVGTNLEQV